jgi:hypothetical protein
MSQQLNDFVVNHKYEVKQDPTHGLVLFKDGQQSRCHFQQAMPVAGKLEGSFDLMFMPCSTRCTKAQIISSGDQFYFGQECGIQKTAFKVEIQPQEEPKPKLTLVK